MLPYEPVSIDRSGAQYWGLVDPDQKRIYLPVWADAQAGDVAGFRSSLLRLLDVERWAEAGVVAMYEDPAPLMPDLGQVIRGYGDPSMDEETGVITPGAPNVIWSGICKVEPREADGSLPELGEQRVSVVPFIITAPLSLVDVQPGDQFKVTQSRDSRLLVRTLQVTAVRASSSELFREVFAFDNQG